MSRYSNEEKMEEAKDHFTGAIFHSFDTFKDMLCLSFIKRYFTSTSNRRTTEWFDLSERIF